MIPESVHWFRIADNNPFVIDATVIDSDTFSRSVAANLPAGHSWAANANRRAGEELGVQSTQSVMYGLQVEGELKTSLTADDVNMVKMAFTGVDLQAGTADDYSVNLQFVGSCDGADVLITLGETVTPATLAQCRAGVDFSFPQNPLLARHLSIVPEFPGPLVITLNQNITWDTGQNCGLSRGNASCVFADGFETGDTAAWNQTVP